MNIKEFKSIKKIDQSKINNLRDVLIFLILGNKKYGFALKKYKYYKTKNKFISGGLFRIKGINDIFNTFNQAERKWYRLSQELKIKITQGEFIDSYGSHYNRS